MVSQLRISTTAEMQRLGRGLLTRLCPATRGDGYPTVQQTVGTRSDIEIAALTAYLMPNGSDELAALRRRIEALEKRIGG
jgi:hypothetical protein